MQTTIWVISAIAVAVLAVGAVRTARRNRRTLVPAAPVTISVTEPTVDTLESPRHAAEARAMESADHVDGGIRRRAV